MAAQGTLPATCPPGKTSHLPGQATPIDIQCGADGVPVKGNPGEVPQNQVKNNFCTDSATAQPIDLAKITSLHGQAEAQESKLKFKAGEPPPNRAFLKPLGEGNLVVFEGYIFEARQEGGESVNCKSNPPIVPDEPDSHDIHIAVLGVPRKTKTSDPKPNQDKEECTGFVAEMTPHHRPAEWTPCNVNTVAEKGLKVRITGQQLFDGSHVPCKNGAPVGDNPKRVSLWEIHPIYSFEVCLSGDCASGGWEPLEKFAATNTACAEKKGE